MATPKPAPTPKTVPQLARDFQLMRASTTMSVSQLNQLLTAQSAANKAVTPAALQPLAAAMASAIQSDDARLVHDRWPKRLLSDLNTMVSSDTRLADDLQQPNPASFLAWLQAFEQDDVGDGQAEDQLERDLRLSPSGPLVPLKLYYQQQYLVIVTPLNETQSTFYRQYNALPSYPTLARLSAVCAPYAAAYQTFQDELLRAPWPSTAQSDIQAVVTQAGVLAADLTDVGLPSINAWSVKMLQDDSNNTAANTLRAALGLPPPS
jgi:hypothetical protein